MSLLFAEILILLYPTKMVKYNPLTRKRNCGGNEKPHFSKRKMGFLLIREEKPAAPEG